MTNSNSCFLVGVFVLAALVTYNCLSIMFGHTSAQMLGQHMDSHLNLNRREDAFSFEPHVVEAAAVGGAAGTGAASPSPPPPPPPPPPPKKKGNGKFHVLLTANDAQYVKWQSRIMYHYYKKIKAAHPDSGFGGVTRILHSGHPDDLMDEIPTVVVDTLPPNIGDDGYVVLHRPYAFKQWLDQYADSIEEEFVLMSEPDHLYLRPIPLLATEKKAAAFPFFYITPKNPKYTPIVQRFNDARAPLDMFAPIGNSPVMISKSALKKVVPVWHELAVKMKKDPQANEAFGWVVEMWAYSIASAQVGVEYDLIPEFMLQPPWDQSFKNANGKDAYLIHYTYGDDFDDNGRFTPGKVGTWHWDKRDYMARAPEKISPPPKGANKVAHKLIEMINDAIDEIPKQPGAKPWGI